MPRKGKNIFVAPEAKLFALTGGAERYPDTLYPHRLLAMPGFTVATTENARLPVILMIGAKCSVFPGFIFKMSF